MSLAGSRLLLRVHRTSRVRILQTILMYVCVYDRRARLTIVDHSAKQGAALVPSPALS